MALTKISTAMWNAVPHHLSHDFNVDDVLFVDVSADRVGIGTNSPQVQLHVISSATTFAQVRVEAGADGYDSSIAYSQNGTIKGISGYDDSSDTVAIKYGTFGGNGIDIDSSGNVGIGTDSPIGKLDVFTDGVYYTHSNASSRNWLTAANYLQWGDFAIVQSDAQGGNPYTPATSTVRLKISASGDVGLGVDSPTSKLEIKPTTGAGQGGTVVLNRAGDRSTLQSYYVINSTGYGDELYMGVGANSSDVSIGARHGSISFQTGSYAERLNINTSGNVVATVDMRAPIFYDSDNTSYYLNPNSTSQFNGGLAIGTTSWDTTNLKLDIAGNASLRNGFYMGISTNNYNSWSGRIYVSGSSQYWSGQYWGFNGTGWGGGNYWTLDNSGNSIAYGSHRAPIFYDSDNTGYYVDPASTSNLNTTSSDLFTAGQLRFKGVGGNSGQTAYDYAIYQAAGAWSYPYPDLIVGWHTGIRIGAYWNYGGIRFYNNSPESAGATEIFSVGNGDDHVRVANYLYAPIVYDSNNTGYYVDPNSGSLLNAITADHLNLGGASGDYGEDLQVGGIRGRFTNELIHLYNRVHIGNPSGWASQSAPNYGLSVYGGVELSTNTSYTTAGGSMRAPIFYDSNDTNYYVDPNSTSNLNTIQADKIGGFLDAAYTDFYVYGNENTYYPVTISGGAGYGFHEYSITRGYSWTAPWDPIGTGAHRGGLTFNFYWSGDIAWGGNDHNIRVKQFTEQYTTMVAGLALPVTGGVLVWLRGGGTGGAQYRLRAPRGHEHNYTVYDGASQYSKHSSSTTFTAANGASYGSRTSTSNVQSEIYDARYPIRNSNTVSSSAGIYGGEFYDYNDTSYYVNPAGGSVLRGTVTLHDNDSPSPLLDIRADNASPWAIRLYRDDLSTGPQVYASDANTWYFNHTVYAGTSIRCGTDARAAYYYDIANTTYFGDFANTGDSIRAAGDIIAYYSSDKRLKDNIIKINSALDKVNAIGGYTFEWNEVSHKETGKKDIGVIAQEVEEIFPEIVQTRSNGYKAVNYEKLVPLLIEAVKELSEKVKMLENK